MLGNGELSFEWKWQNLLTGILQTENGINKKNARGRWAEFLMEVAEPFYWDLENIMNILNGNRRNVATSHIIKSWVLWF